MKNKNPLPLLALLLISLIAVTVLLTEKAQAQAYQGHLRFLENFAVRLYDRGETSEAMTTFKRLQEIDPGNTVAADYLKKLQAGVKPALPSKNSAERLNNITQDIEALKRDVASYESDTKELETIIRDLITENDGLYVMLDKRTRELMELRSQLFGTTYLDNYRELEKTLPVARIPQRLHRSEDYLPATTPGTLAANTNLSGTANVTGAEAEKLLKDKRELMVNKNLTVSQTNKTLEQLKAELTDMNARLKHANSESVSMFEIDRYYRDIKEEAALRNFDSQKAYNDLIVDYAAKVRDLENLKSSLLLRDNALTNVKPQITTQANDVARLNQALADKDREIASLNERVTRLQEENAVQKAALLDRQSANMPLTVGQLEAVNTEVGKLEALLRANDQKIAELESRSSRMTMQTSEREAAVADKKTTLTMDLQQQNAGLKTALADREKDLTDARKAIQALKSEAGSLKAGTTDRGADLKKLEDRLAELDNAASRKATALTEQKDSLARVSSRLDRMERQIEDLNQTIADKNVQLQSDKLELVAKDKKLYSQDNTILELEEKAQLLDRQRLRLQEENQRLTAELHSVPSGASATPMDARTIASLQAAIAERDARIKTIISENRRLLAMIRIYEARSRAGAIPAASPAVDEASRQDQLNTVLEAEEKATLIKSLQDELADREKALTAAQTKVADIELQSSASEIKKQAMKNVIDKRDDDLLKLKSELDLAYQNLAQRNAEVAQLRDVQNKLFVAETQVKDSTREAGDLRMEITQVREVLRATNEDLAKREVVVSRLEAEKKGLTKALARKTEPLTKYQDKMKAFTWKTAQEQRALKNELAKVKAHLTERNAEIASLQKKIQDLSRQLPQAVKKPESKAATGKK